MDVMKNTTSNPSNCDGQIAPKKKRDEKICQEILHNKKSNWDGRTDMPQKNRRNIIQLGWTNGYGPPKKEKHHPIGMDRYAKKYYMRKKHPIRTETDMTRKYYIRTIQLGWTDTTKYYIKNIRRI
jgi:hypothetical protein